MAALKNAFLLFYGVKRPGWGGLVLTVWIAPAAFKGAFLLRNRVKKAKARQRWVVRSPVKGGFAV